MIMKMMMMAMMRSDGAQKKQRMDRPAEVVNPVPVKNLRLVCGFKSCSR